MLEPCIDMKIFAPLGTQKFPFSRLTNALCELADKNDVTVQSACREQLEGINVHNYIPFDEFERLIIDADLVICHGGVNTIISRMRTGKPLVIVPRRAEYGEHIDNHQFEIALRLHNTHGVVVTEPERLQAAINEAMNTTYKPWAKSNPKLGETVRSLIVPRYCSFE